MSKSIRIEGVIGMFGFEDTPGTTSAEIAKQIKDLNLSSDEDLTVIINSEGGSVVEGFGIFNQLKALPNEITVRIEGMAASIAALISMAGDNIEMSEIGLFMIHRASNFVEGNKEVMEKQADILETVDANLIQAFSKRTGLNRRKVENMLSDETWFTAKEAFDMGFIDKIVNKVGEKAVALMITNTKNMKKFNALKKLFNLTTNQEVPTIEEVEELIEEKVQEVAEPIVEEIVEEKVEEAVETAPAEEEVVEEPIPVEEEEEEVTAQSKLEAKVDQLIAAFLEVGNKVELLETGLVDMIDERVKAVARGVRSNGTVPTNSNTNLKNGVHPDYKVKPHVTKFKERMKEIDNKTRASALK